MTGPTHRPHKGARTPTQPALPERSVLFWRHPKPIGAQGRCIGQRSDLPVDPRKSKRLARRIQQAARRASLARVVITSPLRRCADVGRWLSRWGWEHVQDAQLLEMDFGQWDGQPWAQIAQTDVDAWCQNFARHPLPGGECLQDVLQRAGQWQAQQPCTVVTHGGWLQARAWVRLHGAALPLASDWGAAPAYGACVRELARADSPNLRAN